MDPTNNALNQLTELVSKGSAGVILMPANPTLDAQAAATALYLGLTKMGKNVSLACSVMPESEITAIDKVQTSLTAKGDNLIITFPYTEGSIDKVDYNIQGDTFNLIITPREGQPKLDSSKVQFSYAGGKVDYIITVDAPNLNALGAIYTENQQEFQGRQIINIDRHLINGMYGAVNYVVKTSSSTSELVLNVLNTLQCQLDKEIATNLYTGITASTNYFTSYSVTADTFEHAAELLRAGAVKKAAPRQPQQQQQPQPQQNQGEQKKQSFMKPPVNPFKNQQRNQQPQQQQAQPAQQPQQQPQPQAQPQPQQAPQQAEEPEVIDESVNGTANATPQDWLKPKLFRGGGGLV